MFSRLFGRNEGKREGEIFSRFVFSPLTVCISFVNKVAAEQ